MQENKLLKGKEHIESDDPLEETTTCHLDGRSFVVMPVFKEEGANTDLSQVKTDKKDAIRSAWAM